MGNPFKWLAKWFGPSEWANDTGGEAEPPGLFDNADERHVDRFRKQLEDPWRWFK